MGEPALQRYDDQDDWDPRTREQPEEEDGEKKSARERADERWGMNLGDSEKNPEDLEETNAEQTESDQVGSGFKEEPRKNNKKKGRLTGRQKGMTGVFIGLIVGGFSVLTFLSGPAEILQLGAALGKTESAHTLTINKRINRMLYRALLRNPDDRLLVGRSRLGFVQNRTFGGMMDRLEAKHGIKFTETTGRVTGNSRVTVTFDPPADSPLRGRTPTLTRLKIARELSIDAKKIQVGTIGNTDTSFSLRLADFSSSELDGIKKGLASRTGGGTVTKLSPKLAVAFNKRLFSKTLRLPSLFRPVTRASESVGRRVDNFFEARRLRKQADAERSRKSIEVDQRKSKAINALKDAVGSDGAITLIKTTGRAISVQGAMCFVKDLTKTLPDIYYAAVVMPSMIRSIQAQSAASQLMANEDFTLQQMGDISADFKDSEGRNIWGSKSMNALSSGGEGVGRDIDVGAKSAFTTTGGSIAGLAEALGYDEVTGIDVSDSVAGWACSSTARMLGFITGVTITVAGIVGGVVTGGTTTAGALSRVAVQGAQAGLISYAASRILGEFIDGRVKDGVADACGVEYDAGESDKPEDIEIKDAESFGNCLAYASRTSSNINAASMGGVPISGTEETALMNEVNEQELLQFREKSLFARVFSLQEKRSLATAIVRPSLESGVLSGNLNSVASSLLNAPSHIGTGFASIFSRGVQAEPVTYDWGFPMVTLPASVVDDPNYADPLENAVWVADNRSSLDEYKIAQCFGVKLDGEGQQFRAVPLDKEINPLSDEYNKADCGVLSEESWIRTALFVMDDSIARSMDCYDGGSASCAEVGFGGVSVAEPITGTADPGQDTSNMQCPTGTEDGDIQQDYGPGGVPTVKIRICGIPNAIPKERGVNVSIAAQSLAMIQAMRAAGLDPKGTAFRSYEAQQALRSSNCPDPINSRASACSPPTAKSGNSMHEVGLAIDFHDMCWQNATCPPGTNDRYDWLMKNAINHGFEKLDSEAWHWSVSGN